MNDSRPKSRQTSEQTQQQKAEECSQMMTRLGLVLDKQRKFDLDVMELHHVLPYARFQDLITDDRNLLLLCHDCHKEVHCNPFLNIRLMQAKADELGIDLHDRYDYGEKEVY